MALNVMKLDVEKPATEIAKVAHETKTGAIGRALVERLARLQARRHPKQFSLC